MSDGHQADAGAAPRVVNLVALSLAGEVVCGTIKTNPSTCVASLKKRLEKQHCVPATCLKVLHSGVELTDDSTLESVCRGLPEGSEVSITLLVSLDSMLADLMGSNQGKRKSAFDILVKLGSKGGCLVAKAAWDTLLECLENAHDAKLRTMAARTVSKLSKRGDEKAFAALSARLNDSSREVRDVAYESLAKVALQNDENIIKLTRACVTSVDEHVNVKKMSLRALPAAVTLGNADAINLLTETLQDANDAIRAIAVETLVQIPVPGDKDVISHVVECLKDGASSELITSAKKALKHVVGERVGSTCEVLLGMIRCEDFDVQARTAGVEAMNLLADLENGQAIVFDKLRACLMDSDLHWEVRAAVRLTSFIFHEELQAAALEAILQCLHDRTAQVKFRAAVAWSVAVFAQENESAMAAVIDVVNDLEENIMVREAVVEDICQTLQDSSHSRSPDFHQRMTCVLEALIGRYDFREFALWWLNSLETYFMNMRNDGDYDDFMKWAGADACEPFIRIMDACQSQMAPCGLHNHQLVRRFVYYCDLNCKVKGPGCVCDPDAACRALWQEREPYDPAVSYVSCQPQQSDFEVCMVCYHRASGLALEAPGKILEQSRKPSAS